MSTPIKLVAGERQEQLDALLRDVLARRAAGEIVSDEDLVTAHNDLMPELGQRLAALRIIGTAREAADRGDSTVASGSSRAVAAVPHDLIPGCEIRREIHRGGQGVVYEAIQNSTKRTVAIKVIRGGPFSGQADKTRFEREVQVLGQLRHPNIVTVHDSGEVSGHFYYVMDYITGKALDDFVDEIRPASATRAFVETVLALFAKIAEAVNAAHLRGIIHRDLKPGNVRVDPIGDPHVLDFGLAKLSDFDPIADGGARTLTETGQFVGSLPWSSPEQARGRPEEIDLRTDVYALGVMLYQVLTGRFPYEVTGSIGEVLNRILHAEPLPPSRAPLAESSALLDRSPDSGPKPQPSGRANRSAVASWLRRSVASPLNNEVDTIVLKCLAKERGRRYQTAGELARDIRHYLAGEPIEAKRDSFSYVARKQLHRYRIALGVTAAFALVVILGSVVAAVLWRRGEGQSQRAREEAERANKHAQRATDETQRAGEEAARADSLVEMFTKLVQSSEPGKMDKALEESVLKVAERYAHDPRAEARLRDSIGLAYISKERYADGAAQVALALALWRDLEGEEDPATIVSTNNLAVSLVERVSLIDRLTLGMDSEQTKAASELLAQATDRAERVLGPENPLTLSMLNNRANVLRYSDAAAAERLFRDVLTRRREVLGPEDPDTLLTAQSLGALLFQMRRFDEAADVIRDACSHLDGVAADHPVRPLLLQVMGVCDLSRGAPLEAQPLLEKAAELSNRIRGRNHSKSLAITLDLARCYGDLGHADRARELIATILEAQHQNGAGDSELLDSENLLAAILLDQGHVAEARVVVERVRPRVAAISDPNNAVRLIALSNEAALLRRSGEWQAAETRCGEVLLAREAALGNAHPHVLRSLHDYGTVLADQGKHSLSERYLRRAVDGALEHLTAGHWLTGTFQLTLGLCLKAQNQLEDARTHLAAAHQNLSKSLGESHPRTRAAFLALSELESISGNPDPKGTQE